MEKDNNLIFPETLVKYNYPELVSKNTETKSVKVRPLKPTQQLALSGPVSPPTTSPSSDAVQQQREDILNAILPPREFVDNDQLWVQQVSSTPCTRTDVIHLQEELDLQLKKRQARDMGICPVRRELYTQCFDELIRQVTINCAERGVLLLRVRDEIRMTLSAYQTLYESSVAFGMRKALQSEQLLSDMEQKIVQLEKEKEELERQLNEQKAKFEAMVEEENERRQAEQKKHAEELQNLRNTNQQLKTQMELLFATKK